LAFYLFEMYFTYDDAFLNCVIVFFLIKNYVLSSLSDILNNGFEMESVLLFDIFSNITDLFLFICVLQFLSVLYLKLHVIC
jgi:hypothetical protein